MVILHWLTAILILSAWLTAEGGRGIRENPPLLHFTLGVAVLLLVLARVIARLVSDAPEPPWTSRPLSLMTGASHVVLMPW